MRRYRIFDLFYNKCVCVCATRRPVPEPIRGNSVSALPCGGCMAVSADKYKERKEGHCVTVPSILVTI